MNRSLFQIAYSGWWVVLLILISAAVSYFLYVKKDVPWTSQQNLLLFSIRSIAIFLILFLLLDPSIRQIKNSIKKPVLALAIDNSQSILGRGGNEERITESISELKKRLIDLDLEVETFQLNESDSLKFNQQTSPLSSLLSRVEEKRDQSNLSSIILISDGIYNRGSSPLYNNYLTPIFTVGMGDSIPPKDVGISRIQYNKVSFKGNQTPIQIELRQEGFDKKTVTITLSEDGEKIASNKLELTKTIHEVPFQISSQKEGLRHLIASVSYDPEESIRENNTADIFLEVIDAKQNVLIVADAPHPDIKAIRSTLNATNNYQTDVFIPSITKKQPSEIYDVVIYHGAFTSNNQFSPKENPGIWYILNNESNINAVNKAIPYLFIEKRRGQADKVSGSFNQQFSKFKIDDTQVFEEYPPIQVPFGEYRVNGPSEVVMYQKLGNVVTNKPLMIFYDDGTKKSAVLMGQNIWTWKLQESAINENSIHFESFISKTVQFLSVKNDKKQFSVDVRSSTFKDTSPIVFDTEVYNDIYERVHGNSIQFRIVDANGNAQNFDFNDSEINSTFKAPRLKKGIYSFQASVKIGEKVFTDNGEFLVENVNTEYLNLTANHRLLQNLSAKTGAGFVHYTQIDNLPEIIKAIDFKPTMKTEERVDSLIKTWWFYLMIFGLFTLEWVLRRYWGSY